VVDVEHRVVGVDRALLGHRVAADPGVVDQHVDAVGGREDLAEAAGHRVRVGDVHFDELQSVGDTNVPGFGEEFVGLGQPAHRAKDAVAGLREGDGGGSPDARIGPRDDGDRGVWHGDHRIRSEHACPPDRYFTVTERGYPAVR